MGNAFLQGVFDMGEGRYHVDWLMRDRSERVCSFYWDTDAELPAKDKATGNDAAPGRVRAAESEPFKEEPPVERLQGEPPLNVKILVNFAPEDAHSAALHPVDMSALVSILRGIFREPRIGKFSVVAFNLQEQRILYRQENGTRIDFPALGEALQSMKLGTVDLKRLSNKNGETDFLTSLIQQELGGEEHPDALIFAGPKTLLDDSVPRDSLKEVGEVEYPVFYMNYNLQPQNVPWRDAIGRAVKFFRGYEFTISKPKDLWVAVSDMVARIVRFRTTRKTAASLRSNVCVMVQSSLRRWPWWPHRCSDRNERLAPYVPSPQPVVERMLEAAELKPYETVYDLGCGDGRILITAARSFKAKAVGVELNDKLVRETRDQVKKLGLENRVSVMQGDLMKADLQPADVVTVYLLTSANDETETGVRKIAAKRGASGFARFPDPRLEAGADRDDAGHRTARTRSTST